MWGHVDIKSIRAWGVECVCVKWTNIEQVLSGPVYLILRL